MRKHSKKILSLLLAIVLALGMLPNTAMATEGGGSGTGATDEKTEAPAPVFISGYDLSENSRTYYADSSVSVLRIRIEKDTESYNKNTLTVEWQMSDTGETDSFAAIPEVGTAFTNDSLSISYKPTIEPGQTKYYRVAVTNKGLNEENMTPTTVYSQVAVITMLEEIEPAIIIDQPMVRENGELKEANDINVSFTTPSTLPYRNKNYMMTYAQTLMCMRDDWNKDQYRFAGWQLRDTLFYRGNAPNAEKIEVTPTAGDGWDEYLQGDGWNFSFYTNNSQYYVTSKGNGTTITKLKDFHLTPVFEKKTQWPIHLHL